MRDTLKFFLPGFVITGAVSLLGFVLSLTIDPQAINMGLGGAIAALLFAIISLAIWLAEGRP